MEITTSVQKFMVGFGFEFGSYVGGTSSDHQVSW